MMVMTEMSMTVIFMGVMRGTGKVTLTSAVALVATLLVLLLLLTMMRYLC